MGSILARWFMGQSRLAARCWLARLGRSRSSQWQIIASWCAEGWTRPHTWSRPSRKTTKKHSESQEDGGAAFGRARLGQFWGCAARGSCIVAAYTRQRDCRAFGQAWHSAWLGGASWAQGGHLSAAGQGRKRRHGRDCRCCGRCDFTHTVLPWVMYDKRYAPMHLAMVGVGVVLL